MPNPIHTLIRATQRAYHPGFTFKKDDFLNFISEDKIIKEIRSAFLKYIKSSNNIVIFGDYDVDGISASYIIWLALNILRKDSTVILPHRNWGYGLTKQAVNKIIEHNPDLIILLDNGINSKEEINFIKSKIKNVKFVIIDHHRTLENRFDGNVLILHPIVFKDAKDDRRPTDACATGLVWALVRPIVARDQVILRAVDQMGAIGTIADSVPLQGFNFGVARVGLLSYEEQPIPALQMLAQAQEYADVSYAAAEDRWRYHIIPVLNAAGRMHDPLLSFTFLTQPKEEILNTLLALNRRRKSLLNKLSLHISNQSSFNYPNRGIYVQYIQVPEEFATPSEVAGLIGLIAQRISSWYLCPAIILTNSPQAPDYLVGSMRMPSGWKGKSAIEILEKTSNLFVRYGGHKGAAGLTMHEKNLKLLLEYSCSDQFGNVHGEYDAVAKIDILKLIYTDEVLRHQLNMLRPFGTGNPHIRICLEDAHVEQKYIYENRIIFSLYKPIADQYDASWWTNDHIFPPHLQVNAAVALASKPHGIVVIPEITYQSNTIYTCQGLRIAGVKNPLQFATEIVEANKSRLLNEKSINRY